MPTRKCSSFVHCAVVHFILTSNAISSTYEILKPADFGLTRYVHIGSRLTGWNAIKSRVEQLGLTLTDDQVKEITVRIKNMGDVRQQSIEDVDAILRVYHRKITDGDLQLGEVQKLDKIIEQHISSPKPDAEAEPPAKKLKTSNDAGNVSLRSMLSEEQTA